MREMMERKIITIGESLLDILFRNQLPVTAKAGGSMLNTAVSLGRLKLPVQFISEFGVDEVGNMIDQFLSENGVDTTQVYRYLDLPTTLALAFLDEKNNARYSFYKNYPADHLVNISLNFREDDIFLFGSFFAISTQIRDRLKRMLDDADKAGAIIMYDPNFRKTHLPELDILRPMLDENFKYARLVKGSDEDFKLIFQANNVWEAYNSLKNNSLVLVYTCSDKGVWLKTPGFEKHYPVPQIEPVSTIGAGDTFSAGIIYGLYKRGIRAMDLPMVTEETWDPIIATAIGFASHVCLSYENYISEDLARINISE